MNYELLRFFLHRNDNFQETGDFFVMLRHEASLPYLIDSSYRRNDNFQIFKLTQFQITL